MNKVLALLFTIAASQLQAASGPDKISPATTLESSCDVLDELRKIESISALATTGATVVYAIAPDDDDSVNFIKELGGSINKLASYALLEESNIMQFTRVLEAVAVNSSWHVAPVWENMEDFDKFVSEFSVAFARSASTEVACYLQGKVIGALLGEETNRIALRTVHIIATTLTVGLLEAAFNLLDEKINKKVSPKNILRIFGEQFYRELAFHTAGELIRLGVENGGKQDYFAAFTASSVFE